MEKEEGRRLISIAMRTVELYMGPQTARSWPHKAVDINHERADINAGLIYARQVCRPSKAPLIKMKMQRNAATDFGFVRVGRETKKDRERKSESERAAGQWLSDTEI